MTRTTSICTLLLLATTHAVVAQQRFDVAAHYTKQEVMIPMRDGVRLYTAILSPRDTSRQYPIVMQRTPYSCRPYGPQQPPGRFAGNQPMEKLEEGYISVCQDVRGRYLSEGTYADVRPVLPAHRVKTDIDETTDTYDTVDWLIKHVPHNNGRVGISGISYPGFYTWMGTIGAHPAVKATSPQAPVSKWMGGDDFFHNGALLLAHAFDFYSSFGWPRPAPKSEPDRRLDHGTPDEYDFFLRLGPLSNVNPRFFHDSVAFWNQMAANDHWDDFWAARNILPHLKDLQPATLVVGGWFDTENLFGALNSYQANERQSPGAANYLVMGPWYHGEWNNDSGESLGSRRWGSATSRFYTDSIETPFFDHYLKGQGQLHLAEATVFNTGANRWYRFDAWPPRDVVDTRLYLREGGSLSFDPPGTTSGSAYDEYVNDPSRPVPYTAETRIWYNRAFMLEDQRFAARRPDVLVYESPVLDRDVTIAGPIIAHLIASTSGTDADWVVKLIDVYPDTLGRMAARTWFTTTPGTVPAGYQMLVRGDVLRGKFRNDMAHPEPFQPGVPTTVEFRLQDAFHTFLQGHRIMVQVQSSWFPMIDRNPGKFMNIFQARAEDFQKTTQRVYRSADRASFLVLKVRGAS